MCPSPRFPPIPMGLESDQDIGLETHFHHHALPLGCLFILKITSLRVPFLEPYTLATMNLLSVLHLYNKFSISKVAYKWNRKVCNIWGRYFSCYCWSGQG